MFQKVQCLKLSRPLFVWIFHSLILGGITVLVRGSLSSVGYAVMIHSFQQNTLRQEDTKRDRSEHHLKRI